MTPRRLIEPARLASTAVLRGQNDDRLVDLTRAGNERAFEAIVHRYRWQLLRYCARILPPGRAEDAVQQAFLSAYNAISEGDRELKLRPWLYRIARNSALNRLRQNGWDHEQLDERLDGVIRPDQAVEGSERMRSLLASVKGLPPRQRDAIVLRELEGRSYEEIAVALGVTDGAVRQLLNRARTTLRAGATALTPYGLVERIAAAASGRGPAVGERIAEICSGAGGAVSLAKLGTAVLVAGAVVTGAANHGVPGHSGSSSHHGAATANSAGQPGADAADAALGRDRLLATSREDANRRGFAHRLRRHRHEGERRRGGSRHLSGERSDGTDTSGGERSSLVDDHSGSGSSGGGDRHSGSGEPSGSGISSDSSAAVSGSDGSSGSGETTTTTTTTDSSGPGSGELTDGGGTSGGSH